MIVTIEVPADVEAGLLARARAEGLDVADYVRILLSKVAASTQPELVIDPPMGKKKRLSELFAPLRGADIDFGRNPSTGRPVNL